MLGRTAGMKVECRASKCSRKGAIVPPRRAPPGSLASGHRRCCGSRHCFNAFLAAGASASFGVSLRNALYAAIASAVWPAACPLREPVLIRGVLRVQRGELLVDDDRFALVAVYFEWASLEILFGRCETPFAIG